MIDLSNLTNNNRKILPAAIFLLLLSVGTSFGQGRAADTNTIAGNEEIRGTVKFPPGVSGVPVTVILRSLGSPEAKSVTNSEGEFRFAHLRPDSYTVLVDAGDSYEKESETVSVGFSGAVPAQGNPFSYSTAAVYEVQVHLRPKGAASGSAVSIDKIPDSAKKILRDAVKAQKAGNHNRAIEHLKAVITQAPNFTPAYIELGSEYLKVGQGAQAVATFEGALLSDPDNATLRLNYGIALINQKRFEAGEAELRTAIQKIKA